MNIFYNIIFFIELYFYKFVFIIYSKLRNHKFVPIISTLYMISDDDIAIGQSDYFIIVKKYH